MKRRVRRGRWAFWVAPPLLLGAVGLGAALVRAGPIWIFGAVVGALALVPIVWVIVSALWPAEADRRCPRCGAARLERLRKDSTVGIRCRRCAYVDTTASAWLLAEEEGPLEETVLRERAERRARRHARAGREMDTARRER